MQKEINSKQAEATGNQLETSTEKQWLYVPVWCRKHPLLADGKVRPIDTSWLIFEDSGGFGREISEKLIQLGCSVIRVTKGLHYYKEEATDNLYVINPASREDFRQLFRNIQERNIYLDRVLDCDSLDQPSTLGELFTGQRGPDETFFNLLYMAQAFGEFPIFENLIIYVLSRNQFPVIGNEKIEPLQALITGPCKVIPREYSRISCSNIDLERTKSSDTWMMETLLTELFNMYPENTIAIRGHYRWTQEYQPYPLPVHSPDTPLKDKGVYLIIGGLGGIGMAIAEDFCHKKSIHLALLTYSPFPERNAWEEILREEKETEAIRKKIEKLLALEKTGSTLKVIRADASDFALMQKTIDKIESEWGAVNGIVHTASVLLNGQIQHKAVETVQQVFKPKVYGTIVLDALFKNKPLDFFVFFSSSSAILGNTNFVDYCAANAFQDAYAENQFQHNIHNTVSIAWDEWSGIGITASDTYKAGTQEKIPVKEGLEIMYKLMDAKISARYVVIPSNLNGMLTSIRQFMLRKRQRIRQPQKQSVLT